MNTHSAQNSRKLLTILIAAITLLAPNGNALAQLNRNSWTAPAIGPKSYGYFDPSYPTKDDPAQHLGVDIDMKANDTVLSPVDGVVIANNTKGYSADAAHLIIKDNVSGAFHVLGHIASDLKEKATVTRGMPVGKVMIWIDAKGHDNSHVHWGVNSKGLPAKSIDRWGWGRAPLSATPAQAKERGWLDVTPYLGRTRPVIGGEVQGPAKPVFAATTTVGKATFNLPDRTQLLPDQPCSDAQLAQIQKKFALATRCVGQISFGPTTIIVFQNWEQTEAAPGRYRAIALRKSVTDLGSISAREGVQGVLIEGRFFEILAVTLKGWSKRPDDPPYLRYRFDESGGVPKLVLIGNALSARADNPIRKDIASLNSPLRRIFSKPNSTGPAQQQAGTNGAVATNEPTRRTPQSGSLDGCASADWTGTVRSIPDLFECDTPRAISSLSQGRQVQIRVESVQFSNGKYIVIYSDRPSHTKQAIDDMNNKNFDWGKWNDATQSRFYSITCIFPPSAGGRLKKGALIIVTAVLQNFSGDAAQFTCS